MDARSLPTSESFPEKEPTPEPPAQSSLLPATFSHSFLITHPVSDVDPLKDDTELHKSYTDLRNHWGINLSEDGSQPAQDVQARVPTLLKCNPSNASQSSLPGSIPNDLKSITELRSKGEGGRFLEEVGCLFDGLESLSTIGLQRVSALEVVNNYVALISIVV